MLMARRPARGLHADSPIGLGETAPDGAGRFLSATLCPIIRVLFGADIAKADSLHHEVSKYCFIARSMNFPITYQATDEEIPATLGAS